MVKNRSLDGYALQQASDEDGVEVGLVAHNQRHNGAHKRRIPSLETSIKRHSSARHELKHHSESKTSSDVEVTSRRRPWRWDVDPAQYELRKQQELGIKRINETPQPSQTVDLYKPAETAKIEDNQLALPEPPIEGLELFSHDDAITFEPLLQLKTIPDSELTKAESARLEALMALLRIKNGTQSLRKRSMRQLNSVVKRQGPSIILPATISIFEHANLGDHEKHLLMKVISRVMYISSKDVTPWTAEIVHSLGPMLLEDDFTVRMEAQDVLAHLTKVVGLPVMISSLRPDLDHSSEYTRNVTAKVFAVVANTIGLVSIMPFLRAVLRSKIWTTRHTGVKIIQNLAVNLGGGNGGTILPFLDQIVDVLKPAISDENIKVSRSLAITIARLAENVRPFGFDSFEPIIVLIWEGLREHRGGTLAAFISALGAIVPLACHNLRDREYANYYTKELLKVMTREFSTSNEEIKRTILKLLGTLPLTRELLGKQYKENLFIPFVKNFWTRRTATDSQNIVRMVSDATSELAHRLDPPGMFKLIAQFMRDKNELMRRMCVEATCKFVLNYPKDLIEFDAQLEYQLIDGMVFAFQEQRDTQAIYMTGFAALVNALGKRVKPHIDQIVSVVLYNLLGDQFNVRQQAASIINKIAPVINTCCDTPDMMYKLILVLFELLGDVNPEVLASIIDAIYGCLNALGSDALKNLKSPLVNEILPTLTPILKNRHESVQESCVKLVGLIASKQPETINTKEWMRVCFELLDLLKLNKKRIRIAANGTFGSIARTIGPSDVLVMLLNNLRVQERQFRVCTAVAIGIVADTCSPFTVLPAIMNEYRIPDKNVQNGVLKAVSFMIEYLPGNVTKDYVLSLVPLLEHALVDSDQVHRQTAAAVIRHMALNCIGTTDANYIEVFVHFINLVLPNIFETSPHVIIRIIEALDALRCVVGNGTYLNYIWAGLFHPATKVRQPYWQLYNVAYVQNSDAMVPFYPMETNKQVDELELLI
ncbi:hypothetical protein JNB11_04040 [Kocuria palustris]|nr:hypothetical protein [Kocuria palustris]